MIDTTKRLGKFGEVFITNDDVEGGVEQLKHFRGKLINSACGGFKKLFIIEDGLDEGVVSTLHSPENDQYQYTYTDQNPETYKSLEEVFNEFSGKGNIKKVISGKKHNVILTEDGKVYTYGVGEYGSLGHGGVLFQEIPRILLKLQQFKIAQIACGEYHTIALTDQNDLFSWGRGFEGQLGIKDDTSAVPRFINHFYEKFDHIKKCDEKMKLKYITCGSYHSMVISEEGDLYIWGEAKLGQCGTGRKKSEPFPTKVQFDPLNTPVLENPQTKINPLDSQPTGNSKVIMVSGGFGHTACITESGELYTWGFNIKGQLGHGDQKTRYKPVKVQIDILGKQLPKFKYVKCGYSNTFAIDQSGELWSFGGGNLGQKNVQIQDLPRKITENCQNRNFTEICSTQNAAVFFAPMRIMSVRPNYGPSSGGTLITLLGTGFADTSKQSLRFVFGKYQLEVPLSYDQTTESFNCKTPQFEDVSEENIEWPLSCELQVTLDGKNYNTCEQNYLIYSSRTAVTSINPKCAQIQGGSTMTLQINIDDTTSKYLQHLTVGFQRRTKKTENMFNSGVQQLRKNSGAENIQQQLDQQKQQQNDNRGHNPLDMSINDPQLEKEDIICVSGTYSKGNITCTIPQILDKQQNQSMFFGVDVSLNGQQFTGQPNSFRFYDVQIKDIQPRNVPFEGGANVIISGDGFFDTINKKIMFETQFGERLIDIIWDKKDRSFSFIAPPISWLVGGVDPTPEMYDTIKSNGADVKLTLNGMEWIYVGKYMYTDPQIERFGPYNLDANLTSEQVLDQMSQPQEIVDPLQGVSENELDKKQAEIQKLLDEEMNEMATLFKKSGQHLYIHGSHLIESDSITVQFIYDNKATTVPGYYKNQKQLAVTIPEIDDVPQGIQDIQIEISFNNQQYTSQLKTFRYLAFDKNMSQAEKDKFEADQLKQLKVPAKKKK